MTEVFKMKLILIWICIISETFPLPTKFPNVENTTACCEQNPKLIYQGRDSNRGINVYVFQFLPKSKEAKDRIEDTTMKNDFQSKRNAPSSTENGEIYEDTMMPTNKPASIYDKKPTPGTEIGARDNTHMPGLKFSTAGAAQNDTEMYENTGLLSNTTHGLQTGASHIREPKKTSGHSNQDDYYVTESSALLDIPSNRNTHKTAGKNYEDTVSVISKPTSIYGKYDFPPTETGTRDSISTPNVKFDTITSTVSGVQNDIESYENRGLHASVTEGLQTTEISLTKEVRKTSGYSNGDDYYGTEGSTLLDIPGYNDTDMGTQGTNTDFLPNINDSSNNVGCFEPDGQCNYPTKPGKDIFMTQPPKQKDLIYSEKGMDRPDGHAKEEKNTINHKVKSSMKKTQTNKRKGEKQIKRILHYSSGKKQKSGGKRHNYRHSSSESRSDSSQEFD